MKIHNLYSDLMVSLANYISKLLKNEIKGIEYNIGNATYQLEKKTSFDLPRMIVSLENATLNSIRPQTYRFLSDNINQQRVMFNKTKNLEFYIQEDLYNVTISVIINYDRNFADVLNAKHIIENFMPIDKYLEYFSFISFFEIPKDILEDSVVWIDVYNDMIDNLFFRYDPMINANISCFSVFYKPLIKTTSINFGNFIDDTESRTYSINLEFDILIQMPSKLISPRILNERFVDKIEKTYVYSEEIPVVNAIRINDKYFIPIDGTPEYKVTSTNNLTYFKVETNNNWGEGVFDEKEKYGILETGNFTGINISDIQICDDNKKISFILETQKDLIMEGSYTFYYSIPHIIGVDNVDVRKFHPVIAGHIFQSLKEYINPYQHNIKEIKILGYKKTYLDDILFFPQPILSSFFLEFQTEEFIAKFSTTGKLIAFKSMIGDIFSLIVDIKFEYNSNYGSGYISKVNIDYYNFNPMFMSKEYINSFVLDYNHRNFIFTDLSKFKPYGEGKYILELLENIEIIEVIPKKKLKISKNDTLSCGEQLVFMKNKLIVGDKYFNDYFVDCSTENPILIKGQLCLT